MDTATQPWQIVNDRDKRDAIRMLAMGVSPRVIARRLGRTVDILYDWAQNDAGFARALNALASSKDDAAQAYQLRLRRMADGMLDEIEELATSTAVPAAVRANVLKTFFADVHNPALLPRAGTTAGGPVVIVSAEQAAILMAPMGAGVKSGTASEGSGGARTAPPEQRDQHDSGAAQAVCSDDKGPVVGAGQGSGNAPSECASVVGSEIAKRVGGG